MERKNSSYSTNSDGKLLIPLVLMSALPQIKSSILSLGLKLTNISLLSIIQTRHIASTRETARCSNSSRQQTTAMTAPCLFSIKHFHGFIRPFVPAVDLIRPYSSFHQIMASSMNNNAELRVCRVIMKQCSKCPCSYRSPHLGSNTIPSVYRISRHTWTASSLALT